MADELFKVISLRDSAVDWPGMLAAGGPDAIREYWETRKFELVQPFIRPGEQPTIYLLREVPNDLADDYVLGAEPDDRDMRMYRRAFKAGLMRVRNLRTRDGVVLPEFEPARDRQGVMQDRECARFGQLQRLEMGSVALQIGFFPPGTEPIFQLPQSFLLLLAHPTHRNAGPSSALRASSSDAASSLDREPTASMPIGQGPSHTDSPSGSPTDATAPVRSAAAG